MAVAMMDNQERIEITEHDEAGEVTATYITSSSGQSGTGAETMSRVDVIMPEAAKTLWQRGIDVFLPAGFPHSVTEDYLE